MAEGISSKEGKILQSLIKDLEAQSCLDENETVQGGFFHIIRNKLHFLRQSKYYGLLTQKKLILIQKKSISKPNKFEMIPFDNIKELFYVRVRLLLYLLVGFGYIGFFAWAFHFFYSVSSIIDPSGFPFPSIYWIMVILCVIAEILCIFGGFESIFIIREFIRGTDVNFLEISAERTVMLYPITHKFARHLTFLNFLGSGEVTTKKATMEDLYDILSARANCKGVKLLKTKLLLFYLFPLGKLKEKIIQWQLKNGEMNG
jgi:hypothetical protein